MISVVIPLYNKEGLIGSTLKSVLGQTYRDFEIVVVDDGSTDGSAAEVSNINDARIRLIRQENAGVSSARNRGIKEAKGEIIAFLDADDQWYDDFLHTISSLSSNHPDCHVFATRYEYIDEFGNINISVLNDCDTNNAILENYFHIASVSDSPICSSAVAATKAALLDIGGFPVGITSGEDLLTWARLAAKYKIAYCVEPKARYYTPTTGPTGKVPVDLESTKDAVGTALIELAKQFPKKGINEYVSFWYKMRAVINLGRNNRRAAMRCALKSIKFRLSNIKSWAILPISCMPKQIIRKALHK